ncbi:hypothetical protein [Benzoatithermus flavus]|uniref:Uncharacterized protein n=1 Tax=Benzoatithermus flavus TaxID=3108223 RepID=A0ABU8XN27_9PROT
MSIKLTVTLDVEMPEPSPDKSIQADAEDRAMRLAEAIIVQLLPQLANEIGIEKHRLAGSLLVELGYVVGLSHTPAAAVDALAVATERMRDAIASRRDKRPTLPAPTVQGPATLQ